MTCPSCDGNGYHWSWCWRRGRGYAALGALVLAFAVWLLFLEQWAQAQPHFRETDGGTRTWDAGRKGWPNPDGEDRTRDYPRNQP